MVVVGGLEFVVVEEVVENSWLGWFGWWLEVC
jgi:hypothetical protein